MKHYIRLFKRKHFLLLLIMLLLGIIGVYVLVYPLDNIVTSFRVFEYRDKYDLTVLIYLFTSRLFQNAGYVLTGLIIIHFAFVFLPVSHRDSQDLEQFTVESDAIAIHIRYKKNEWLIEREHFSNGASLMFFDKNYRFVSLTKAYQVYNAVIQKKEFNYVNGLENSGICSFYNSQLVDIFEVHKLIDRLKLSKRVIVPRLIAILFSIIGISMIIECSYVRNIIPFFRIIGCLLFLILGSLFLLTGFVIFSNSLDGNRQKEAMLHSDVSKVKVFCYEKNTASHNGYTDYYIKICDGYNTYLANMFKVTKDQYDNVERLTWYAYFYENGVDNYVIYLLSEDNCDISNA